MMISKAKARFAADLSASTRAVDGAFPERMIAFTGPRSEGAIQDARA